MLDEMTPRQFDEWMAADAIEPIGQVWTIEVLKLGLATLANLWVADHPFRPEHFDPAADSSEKPTEQFVSPNAAAAMFTAAVGGFHGQ